MYAAVDVLRELHHRSNRQGQLRAYVVKHAEGKYVIHTLAL